jgi:DNA-binding transcriptional LysR family regulator
LIQYTLKQLAYFAGAAERGSVTRAAQALHVSQPSISTAIAHLERVLATPLFLRHHAQGLSLTPAGRRLFAEARGLLAHAEELALDAAGRGEHVRGELQLGYFVTFAPYCLPQLLARFTERYPEVSVRLHEGDMESLGRALQLGTLDLALVYDLALGPELARTPLAELAPYALLPAGHPLARKKRVSLSALAKAPFILLDLPHSREYFRSVFLANGLEPEVRYSTPSLEMVRGLVARGLGVGLLNVRPAGDRAYDGSALACRPLVEAAPALRIVLVRPAQLRPTRTVEALIACAGEVRL